MACRDRCQVNTRLLPVKVSYYFTLAAVASLLPYLAIYMKHLGLSPSETAIIHGTMPFLGAIVRPFIGALADKFHQHKALLMIVCILTGVFHACLLAVPRENSDSPGAPVLVSCDKSHSHVQYCRSTVPHTECDAPDLINITSRAYDPFFNSSWCVLQCQLMSKDTAASICFTGHTEDVLCAQPVLDEPNTNITLLEFMLEEMNHSFTRYMKDESEPRMCHYYAMTGLHYNKSAYQQFYCPDPTAMTCTIKCDKLYSAKCAKDIIPHRPRYTSTFWWFLFIMFAATVAFAPIFTLIDAITYDFLGEDRGKWGKQRLWGTVGFAIHGLASGFIMDVYSKDGNEFLIAFIMFAVLEVITAIIVCQYRISSNVACGQMLSNMFTLLRRMDILALFVVIFVFGMFTGVLETFLFWYLTQLGATKTLFGLCMFLNCLPEIVILLLSGFIMKRIHQVKCLYIVCFAYSIRFLAYSFIQNPWLVLAVEPIHSITFGLMYAAASSYGSMITPPGMHGTVQGLIGGLHFGFGKGCGTLLGGLVFEAFGAVILFQGCAVIAGVLFLFYFSVQQLLGCRKHPANYAVEKTTEIGAAEEKDEMIQQNGVITDGCPTVEVALTGKRQKVEDEDV